jgi:hypothetical protein
MADHFHDTSDLICRNDASSLALSGDLAQVFALLGFENGRLMQTNRGRVDGHVGKDDIRVGYALRQSKRLGQLQSHIQKNIIVSAVTLPKLPVNIALPIFRIGSMKVRQV